MSSSIAAGRPVRTIGRAILAGFTWRRAALTALLALFAAALLNPVFSIPFSVLVGRMLVVATLLLLAFIVAGAWNPTRIPTWVAQLLAIVLTAPVATLIAYLPSIDGNLSLLVDHPGRVTGFIRITTTVLVIAPLIALGALYRERDAQARAAQLAFELERSTLEKEALDARFKLLQAQIEPHFLFNTLANVQELVESGSPQAPRVLASLIAYLRAAVPKLHEGAANLATELGLVRAYLELMQMRMPDRLQFSVEAAPEAANASIPPMSVLTLVENAIRHGIDPSERGGRIDVSARRDAVSGELRVRVADTGVGMSESARIGTGLDNLKSRLRGFCGEGARLELHELQPSGLCAEIVCPARVAGA